MSTLIVNSNRIDLVDPISGRNKSITIDEVSHKAVIDDGSQINELANQSSVDALATALNNLASAIGTLASLTTEVKTDLVSAINEVDYNADAAAGAASNAQSDATSALINIGTLTNLTTEAKTNLVSAINEVDGHADSAATNIGTLSSLTTTEKSNLVGAINEVASTAGGAYSGVTALSARVNASASQLYGHTVLATTDFVANSDVVTGTEFPYKAVVTVGSLSGDKSATTFSCQTFFDSESILAENFASFTDCVASYDSGTSTTSFANTIYAREPMVVDVTSVVTFTTNVY